MNKVRLDNAHVNGDAIMDFDFDVVINRTGTQSSKWDTMQAKYGVSPETGIAMWVADMDFTPPPAVNDVVQQAAIHGVLSLIHI